MKRLMGGLADTAVGLGFVLAGFVLTAVPVAVLFLLTGEGAAAIWGTILLAAAVVLVAASFLRS